MAEPNPTKNPLDWFARFCLVALFGAVSLTIAVDLLSQIWMWLVVLAVCGAVVWLAVLWWRSRSRPW
ncbi:hypothetical protein [Gordonia rubripertincta]|uniref:hypothetical protein n=1 Tax=Gordonia rubripertincta TaxID=36822 RepID=UPI000B8D3B6D|nr:hypothetical protein [Gordonia rubripertincta]ASR04344.1 hypothetical protein GCWB2_17825 [Gordonia rubripertincta]